jgi:phage terminase large subunit-like protein
MGRLWDEYIEWVEENPTQTCDKVKKAVKRFNAMRQETEKEDCPYYFDSEEPQTVIDFATNYIFIQSDEGPVSINVYPWQAFVIAAIYGFKYKDSNERVVRTAVVSTAKKNGKSTFEAIPVLYTLFSRAGARIYLAALNKEQTSNVFDPVRLTVETSKELSENVDISKKHKTILATNTGSMVITLSRGAETKQGIKPALAVVDEYYLYRDDDLISVLKYGFRSVKSPLLFIITTNGFDKETPYYKEYERCTKILDGIIEDLSTFAIFYEYDAKDKWDDVNCLIKSNPMLGHTLTVERDFAIDLSEAKAKPHKRGDYEMLTCNRWVDVTIKTWIAPNQWEKCNRTAPELTGKEPACIGVDLSMVNDYTSLTVYNKVGDVFVAEHNFYIPEGTYIEHLEDSPFLAQWVDADLIKIIPGDSIDYNYIKGEIERLIDTHTILGVAYDRYKFSLISEHFNLSSITFVDYDQSLIKFSEPTKNWEKAVLDGKIIDSNPVMRWMVSCATIKPDVNGNYKPIKPDYRKSRKRIDGVITSIMAFDLLNNLTKQTETKKLDFNSILLRL